MTEQEDFKVSCIALKGELADWGKHIYLPHIGCTLCGCFTVDYDKEMFKGMPKDVPSEYDVVKWDITCGKCLDMNDLFDGINKSKKAQNN